MIIVSHEPDLGFQGIRMNGRLLRLVAPDDYENVRNATVTMRETRKNR